MTDTAPTPRDALARRLRTALAAGAGTGVGAGVEVAEVAMFGGVAFMVDGRLAVSAGRDGDLLIHVDPADYDRHLQRGAAPAIMGRGRPMGRRWVSVPPGLLEDDGELAYWVGVGIRSGGGQG